MDLRTAIFSRDLKQKAVAKKAGLSAQLISNVIRGRCNLSPESAQAIAKVLKMHAFELANLKWDFKPKIERDADGLPSRAEGSDSGSGARGDAELAHNAR